jgi:chitinase
MKILTVLLVVVSLLTLEASALEETDRTSVSCVTSNISHGGSESWKNISLNLTNRCDYPVNLNRAVITFRDTQKIDAIWYTDNGNTAYPRISLSSQAGTHSASLAFDERSAQKLTELMPGKSVSLNYGTPALGYTKDSVGFYPRHLDVEVETASHDTAKAKADVQGQDSTGIQSEYSLQEPPVSRVIGYLPINWNNSGTYADSIPPPRELGHARYTHIVMAFGVFSIDPNCTETFSCILLTPEGNKNVHVTSGDGTQRQTLTSYITELQDQNIKVLLSLGGASTSFGTVDFAQSFDRIQNGRRGFSTTVKAYVDSLGDLIGHYGFDGVDVDIEQGLQAPSGKDLFGAGSPQVCERRFTLASGLASESGSVCAVAAVIRSLAAAYPNLIISLAPQTLNIAANNHIGGDVLNYSALIANIRDVISWVGIQVYNSGGMFGPDGKIQPITAENQVNASVAMALNLLAGWNQNWPNFFLNNHRSILKPDQVVLGYPASNGTRSDGLPIGNIVKVKQALRCLNQRIDCRDVVPGELSTGLIGGVFNWNVNFDRANDYAFAKSFNIP